MYFSHCMCVCVSQSHPQCKLIVQLSSNANKRKDVTCLLELSIDKSGLRYLLFVSFKHTSVFLQFSYLSEYLMSGGNTIGKPELLHCSTFQHQSPFACAENTWLNLHDRTTQSMWIKN